MRGPRYRPIGTKSSEESLAQKVVGRGAAAPDYDASRIAEAAGAVRL